MVATLEEAGRRLTSAIARSKKTRQQIADAAECSADLVYRFMSGKQEPGVLTAARIAEAAGTTLDALFGLDRSSASRLDSPTPPAQAVAVGLDVYHLPAGPRRAVQALVRELALAYTAKGLSNPPREGSQDRSRRKTGAR